MKKEFDRQIIFEDGTQVFGYGFGASDTKVCEIVFNTSMVGYQEIISDPSYTYQAVTMTYPLIGNYGITDEDYETRTPTIGALICREYCDEPSNFRYTKTLGEVMEDYHIPGIFGVDTRQITRLIRDKGSSRVAIVPASFSKQEGLDLIANSEVPHDAVAKVSCKKRWYSRTPNHIFHVVAIDCGIKLNIIRSLNKVGCNVTIMPFDTTAEQVLALKPDAVFLSNGPGDPQDVPQVVELVKNLKGKLPIFGICLGHQLISLAYGAKTYKLKFGHRGGNHPVKNLQNGKIEITSQNHSYAVDESSLEGTGLKTTHINILDGTVEGVESEEDKIFSVQYHPESAPGPQDSFYLFDKFTKYMKEAQNA